MISAFQRIVGRASAGAMTTLGAVLCATLAGCLTGGGGNGAAAGYGTDARAGGSALDSARLDATNRRILSAAAFDTLGSGTVSDDYEIGPRDVVEIAVFGVEEFSGTFPVDEEGAIVLPLLSPVHAAGNTIRELEDVLETRLRETYVRDPHVTVSIAEMRSHGVSVIGAVRAPGVYQITGPTTLLEVLAMAEGLTEEAGNSVLLVRPNPSAPASSELEAIPASSSPVAPAGGAERVAEVDLGALLESGRTEENLMVRPGDIVQVRPAGIVYVVGEVNRPGGYPVPPGEPMTLLQALAMSQGLTNMASAGNTVIVREREDGTRHEVPVDLEGVMEGSAPSPLLLERDVLFVPRNGGKAFALGAIDTLVRMVTFRGLVY
jgi:polysaccharide biosynthesis/export protein